MSDTPYRLRVTIHGAEFEAEGDKDAVMEQYRLFLEARKAAAAEPAATAARPVNASVPSVPAVAIPLEDSATPAVSENDVPAELIDRAYSRERGVISLRVLPQSKTREPDALLLLLYGYLKLKGEHDVYGTQLMKAAQVSGLSIDRIDRIIVQHRGLYIRGGARRGTRYALNNQGEQRARAILEGMFQ